MRLKKLIFTSCYGILLVCDVSMYGNGETENGLNLSFLETRHLFGLSYVLLGKVFVLLPYVIRCFCRFSILVLNVARGFCTVGLPFCIFGFYCTIAYTFCTIAHLFCIFGSVILYVCLKYMYYCKGGFDGL